MDHEERQFEQNLSPKERALDAMLSQAFMPAPPTKDSILRIVAASAEHLPLDVQRNLDVGLEQDLDCALAVQAPKNLSARIFETTVLELGGQPVIATIGRSVVWRKVALAACLVFAVFVAIRFSPEQPIAQPMHVATNEVLNTEDEGLLLADLNLSEYAYLADTRELAFADVAMDFDMLRSDIELWQYGLLHE